MAVVHVFLSLKDEFVVEPLPNLENDLEAILAKVLDWQNLLVSPELGGVEPAAQNMLLDIHSKFEVKVKMEPTRGENKLDLFFTTNPSLVKNSTVVPGISDYDMVVTDYELRPIYNRPKPRKIF